MWSWGIIPCSLQTRKVLVKLLEMIHCGAVGNPASEPRKFEVESFIFCLCLIRWAILVSRFCNMPSTFSSLCYIPGKGKGCGWNYKYSSQVMRRLFGCMRDTLGIRTRATKEKSNFFLEWANSSCYSNWIIALKDNLNQSLSTNDSCFSLHK